MTSQRTFGFICTVLVGVLLWTNAYAQNEEQCIGRNDEGTVIIPKNTRCKADLLSAAGRQLQVHSSVTATFCHPRHLGELEVSFRYRSTSKRKRHFSVRQSHPEVSKWKGYNARSRKKNWRRSSIMLDKQWYSQQQSCVELHRLNSWPGSINFIITKVRRCRLPEPEDRAGNPGNCEDLYPAPIEVRKSGRSGKSKKR